MPVFFLAIKNNVESQASICSQNPQIHDHSDRVCPGNQEHWSKINFTGNRNKDL